MKKTRLTFALAFKEKVEDGPFLRDGLKLHTARDVIVLASHRGPHKGVEHFSAYDAFSNERRLLAEPALR